MGAEVCAKTCSKRYVPKQPLDTSNLVTGRDGNAGDGNAFQQQLATIFAAESIARFSKANGKWQRITVCPDLRSRHVARRVRWRSPGYPREMAPLTATSLLAWSYVGTIVGDGGSLLLFSLLLLGPGEDY